MEIPRRNTIFSSLYINCGILSEMHVFFFHCPYVTSKKDNKQKRVRTEGGEANR